MSAATNIEWTERTWNPTTGCDRVSPGCDHCYALTMAKRIQAMERRRIALGKLDPTRARYQADGDPRTSGPGFALTLHPESIVEPHHWRKPSVVFVNSMSDLFHARVPYEFVEQVWATMAETQRHTYQVLTKRPDRMERFVVRLAERFGVLGNVWLGMSVESQEYVGRAERLLRVPAAVRFLSCEPLLGPLDLSSVLCDCGHLDGGDATPINDPAKLWRCVECGAVHSQERPYGTRSLHWVIAGGESGHGARPCELDWLRSLRDQCQGAGVAYFVKQLGGYPDKRDHGKALLDGRRWTEMPVDHDARVATA